MLKQAKRITALAVCVGVTMACSAETEAPDESEPTDGTENPVTDVPDGKDDPYAGEDADGDELAAAGLGKSEHAWTINCSGYNSPKCWRRDQIWGCGLGVQKWDYRYRYVSYSSGYPRVVYVFRGTRCTGAYPQIYNCYTFKYFTYKYC